MGDTHEVEETRRSVQYQPMKAQVEGKAPAETADQARQLADYVSYMLFGRLRNVHRGADERTRS